MRQNENCIEFRECLARLEGDRVASLPEAHREHLQSCVECQAYRDALDTLPRLFRELRDSEPPEDMFERLRAKAQSVAPAEIPSLESARSTRKWRALAGSLPLRAAAGFLGFAVVTAGLAEREGEAHESGFSPQAAQVFADLDRNLLHSPSMTITPERELLAHLSRLNENER